MKILFILISLTFLGCASTPNLIDIQDDILTIGGCAISTSGCVVDKCGELITACAAEKCDPVGLSICLISNCGEETSICITSIKEVFEAR